MQTHEQPIQKPGKYKSSQEIGINNLEIHFSSEKCIHQLFEAQVEQRPEAIAVVYEDRQITYRELNQRANQLASYLKSEGIKSEFLVGICVDRSVEMLLGILGILKAGGAYVPIDPNYPAERISFVLQDSQMSILISQKTLIDKLPQHDVKTICIDGDWDRFVEHSEDIAFTQSDVKPNNLAYVIYTSGSTGKPKGVLVEHRNVTRLFGATQLWYNFSHQDVWTMFHSYAFDFAVWEIWGALLYGGRLVVVSYQTSRNPESFYQLLIEEKVTVLNQTPSAFYQLIQADEKLYSPELSLRLVIFGGEALNLLNLKPWFDRHGDRDPQLVNMYGITETTVHVTYRPLRIVDSNSTSSVIGCPIPDLELYLLDSNLQQVPVGIEGEIYVGGAGVARGYLNRPELNAQRFIDDPFKNDPEAKLYRAGDLARYLENGDLEYLGRIDNQVKIRGFRIELGEIEAQLTQHPLVEKCVVLPKKDFSGSEVLVGYSIFKDNAIVSNQEIRDFLKQTLPDYMIPATFVGVETFPLTTNGKLDRRALLNIDAARVSSSETVAPSSELETALAEIWSEVLGIKSIGIKDDFFELGGHSLLAISLVAQIEAKIQKNVPVSTLFQASTVEKLARYIENDSNAQSLLVPIQPQGNKNPLFLIHGGAGDVFWYHGLAQYLDPQQPVYGIEPINIDDCQAPLTTIEEMAVRYIEEMKKLQPVGPYLLGGYCLGGLVAYEMARLLALQGEKTDLLALIDVYLDNRPPLSKDVISRVDKLASFNAIAKIKRIEKPVRWLTLQFAKRMWLVYPQLWLSFPKKLQKEFKSEYFLEVSRQAISKYTIEPHCDRLNVVFFRGILGRRDKTLANEQEMLSMPTIWKGIVPDGVEFVDVDANHHDIAYDKRHQHTMSKELNEALKAIES